MGKEELTIGGILRSTIERFGNNRAFAWVGEEGYTYNDVDRLVGSLHTYLSEHGVSQGDRVTILGANMPKWPVVYLAVTSMGAVAVPILPDFTSEEVENVIEHSESKLIFVSESLVPKVQKYIDGGVTPVISMESFAAIGEKGSMVSFNEANSSWSNASVSPEDLAAIIYTSGTTGRSKGVMLLHRNLASNVHDSKVLQEVNDSDIFLSLLPLSHTLENTVGMLVPLASGATVYYLSKPPTASVLLPALKEIRPTMILAVPLIIEKVFYNSVKPAITGKKVTATLYKIPPFRKLLHRVAGKKLASTFGGRVRFFGIGGAKLNREVERFLLEGRFPYAIGYGLTETSPVLAGMTPDRLKLQSTGRGVRSVELKINNPDPKTGEGEIWAKGPNVMKGYYKEPEMTAEVITEDGWFRTGDLGVFDSNNFLYIKGRLKNVIIGASGENIYPEEIESVINNFRNVVESLVIEQKGKLVALVHLNVEEIEKQYVHMKEEMARVVEEKTAEILNELHKQVNLRMNRFSRIHRVILQPVPFQKTATQKIKRYLYA